MFSPSAAFQGLKQRSGGGRWLALRRPFFLAFFVGCCVSLIVAGRLDLRLVSGETVAWSVLPIFQSLSVAAVCWKKRQALGLSRMIDLFFTGLGPWLLWLIGLAVAVSVVSPAQASQWTRPPQLWIVWGTLVPILSWSFYIDFRFFRVVMECSRPMAVRDVILQRGIAWAAWLIGCYGYTAWPLITWRLSH
jgi:hypothetical protein